MITNTDSSQPAATPLAIIGTIDKATLATIPLAELCALEKVVRTVYDVTAAFACQNGFSSSERPGANRGGEVLADLLDMLVHLAAAVEDARVDADTERDEVAA
ncbi:hypothetical protein [Aurantimonas endophytica]|uniref:Uncharacterized protein n=1 Tax=Aurantimonas endophytica TaxID=1522175 RepID=A0A7W6HDM7_9HYPH|nr:hypothetical protein [Aurantimonas endophytica]MBB4003236.1 hypothetical protein [Aurantimonas endophytica]MCO6404098.1 hypothetical protein [Aurantimonas endophytica]